jgi:hypothetical protein
MPDNLLDPDKGQSSKPDTVLDTAGEEIVLNDFTKDLPDALKKSKSLSKFADKASLAKSYVELERTLGNSVRIPDEKAGKDEWGKFFQRIGRPETPDEYDITKGSLDDAALKALKDKAFARGLTKKQAKEFIEDEIALREETDKKRREAYTSDLVEAEKKLRAELGASFDTKMKGAQTAFERLFTDADLRTRFKESGIVNDPRFIRALIDFSKELREDSAVRGHLNSPVGKPDSYDYMYTSLGRNKS